MDKLLLAYLAGLFDGEGCIVIASQEDYHFLRLKVTNKNKEVVSLFEEIFGCGHVYLARGVKTIRNSIWEWHCQRTPDSQRVLRILLPYLRIKKEQAVLGLSFNGDRIQQEKIKMAIRALNHVPCNG